jgi:hypothetical protein
LLPCSFPLRFLRPWDPLRESEAGFPAEIVVEEVGVAGLGRAVAPEGELVLMFASEDASGLVEQVLNEESAYSAAATVAVMDVLRVVGSLLATGLEGEVGDATLAQAVFGL